jgi:hypothetical protein
MSDQSKPDSINLADTFARRRRDEEHNRQNLKRRQAERAAYDRLGAASGKVEDLGHDYELNLWADEEYLRRWIGAIAEEKAALVALPDRALPHAAAPPAWVVEGDAWAVGVKIFLASDTDPGWALRALAELATTDPKLAIAVARCLRREISLATTPTLKAVDSGPPPSDRDDEPAKEGVGGSGGEGDDPDLSFRRVGMVWHLRYQGESADFAVRGNQFLSWLAKLLSKPDYSWTVAEVLGDPDGKLKADALLGGERATDAQGLREIWERIQNIEEEIQTTGGTEALEDEKAKLLRQVENHPATRQIQTSLGNAYNNITTQKRQFLQKLAKEMPQLAAHLRACIKPFGNDFTISYRPPAGSPRWLIENPPA